VYTQTTQRGDKMPNITLSIPKEMHDFVKKHNEINWSEITRRALNNQIKKMELMDKLVSKSEFTEENVNELDKKIKKGLLKKFQK
jgi:hypothetical protein